MSRSLSAGLSGLLASNAQTRCAMLRLDLRDGTSIGITDHSKDLTFDLGDGAISYSASTGILPSDVTLTSGFSTDNCEISGPIGTTVTLAALLGGKFNRAQARLFQVNWKKPADGHIPILKGYVGEARVEGGKFIFEIRSDMDRLNQVVGRLITPYCTGDHATCCLQIADETTTTISAVTNEQVFEVAASITGADFVNGRAWFTSGTLAGNDPVEIFAVSGSTITLFDQLADLPEIGDTIVLKEGCDRTREMCRDRFDNVINFRGFPEVPGSDQALRMPIPGGSEA